MVSRDSRFGVWYWYGMVWYWYGTGMVWYYGGLKTVRLEGSCLRILLTKFIAHKYGKTPAQVRPRSSRDGRRPGRFPGLFASRPFHFSDVQVSDPEGG
eukprot:scaffold3426_cov145-Amphora_coffeaeformis.AAC.9